MSAKDAGDVWGVVVANLNLGHLHANLGRPDEALRCFRNAAVSALDAGVSCELGPLFAHALSFLEVTCENPEAFRALCQILRAEYPYVDDLPFTQWYLASAEKGSVFDSRMRHNDFTTTPALDSLLASGWEWHDLFGDCSLHVGDRLEIHAANGRDLQSINVSAPRLIRPAPDGDDWVIEIVCCPLADSTADGLPAFGGRSSIGGLLLWGDKDNYLRLDVGSRGRDEISFRGRIAGKNVIVGRGRLQTSEPLSRVHLRMERVGDRVRALCSADYEAWFTVGSSAFPFNGPLQAGLHAIGMMDGALYPGACPEGTAIRFESFTLWALER